LTAVPAAADRMVGIELLDDLQEYATTQGPPDGFYVHALDKGWHLGAVGTEGLHGIPDAAGRNQWGGPQWAKTVILATANSEVAIKQAMLARRFYAIRDNYKPRLKLNFSVDHEIMGTRIARTAGAPLHVVASANRDDA